MPPDRTSRTATGGTGNTIRESDRTFEVTFKAVASYLTSPTQYREGQNRLADYGAYGIHEMTHGEPEVDLGSLGGGDPGIGAPMRRRRVVSAIRDRKERGRLARAGITPEILEYVTAGNRTLGGTLSPLSGAHVLGERSLPALIAAHAAEMSRVKAGAAEEGLGRMFGNEAWVPGSGGAAAAASQWYRQMHDAGLSLSRMDDNTRVLLGIPPSGGGMDGPRIPDPVDPTPLGRFHHVPPTPLESLEGEGRYWRGRGGAINAIPYAGVVPPVPEPSYRQGNRRAMRAIAQGEAADILRELPSVPADSPRGGPTAGQSRARRHRRYLRQHRLYREFLDEHGIGATFNEWREMTGGRRATRKMVDDLKSTLEKARERALLQRGFDKWGPEGLWEKALWIARAPEAFAMRMARFGGPVGLGLLTVFDRDPTALPALLKTVISGLSIKGMPLNQDWMRMSGTTYDMMSLERQHHRELGDEPLFLAETNGFHPRDSYYTSLEEVDRLRAQRGAQDYDTVGLSQRVITWGY